MLHIRSLDQGIGIFKALGSELRIRIIQILQENNNMNMKELAMVLGITNGALTSHVKKLEEAGLIEIVTEHGGHGNQKICRVTTDKILINVDPDVEEEGKDIYNTEVSVGHYSDYKVYPTCGLATDRMLVGVVDDPRYFAHPERYNAKILWFSKGYVEYRIPNLLPEATKIEQITLSLEICSEAPGVNNEWPSDISFFLNDTKIGTWTSPGDFGDVRGIFTPDWWFSNWNQYGLLKMIIVNRKGTYVDGLKISNVKITDFDLDYTSAIRFRLQVEENAANVGGLTIFGRGFGNYNQGIRVRIAYSAMEASD